MNSQRHWEDYLEDILDAVESIEEFILDMGYEEFLRDRKTSFAVVRSLEIIGEATKNIPDSVREVYPDIPWQDMAGMRDIMIHHYFGIDYLVVWKTISEDIPVIKPILKEILNNIGA
ncbi:MAG: DUF86 domain-containing protein [Candidatus Aminicenantes bacterium]|nr:DUF86 domain-containing protein [Candidatus Aminicenantes bacterium]